MRVLSWHNQGVVSMKPRENMVRLRMFQVRGKRREIAQLEMMIAEFERMVLELETQISHEERKSGNNDVHHFAYSALARAARQRRDNLLNSIRDLQLQKQMLKLLFMKRIQSYNMHSFWKHEKKDCYG